MKQSIFFRLSSDGPGGMQSGVLLDAQLFTEIKRIADEAGVNINKIGKESVAIRGAINNPAVMTIMGLLAANGWYPTPKYLRSCELMESQRFTATIRNQYSTKELERFQLFSVVDWGNRWITGTVGPVTNSDCIVGAVAGVGKGWKQKIGIIGNNNFFVNGEVRQFFSDKGVVGIGYRELLWDNPTQAKGIYWQITPSITMPAALTPLVQHEDRVVFDDGPFEACELRYCSGDLEKLGNFDVAWTKEETLIDNYPIAGKHCLVVSKRFRQLCDELKLKVNFAPIRIDSPAPELPAYFPVID